MTTDNRQERLEAMVLHTIQDKGEPISEDEYHKLHFAMDTTGHGLGFSYELTYWNQVDPNYRSEYGSTEYSAVLHSILGSLESKGEITRDNQNPIVFKYSGGNDQQPDTPQVD